MHQHLLRDLDERILWHFNSTSGSSRIASSASSCYQGYTSTRAFPLCGLHPLRQRPRVAALIPSSRLASGNSTSLKLSLLHSHSDILEMRRRRLNPHLSARYRGQPSLRRCLASGLSSSSGGPPNQVVLPLSSLCFVVEEALSPAIEPRCARDSVERVD